MQKETCLPTEKFHYLEIEIELNVDENMEDLVRLSGRIDGHLHGSDLNKNYQLQKANKFDHIA